MMTVFLHELKRNKITLIVWSAVLSFMLGVCVFIYPEMSSQMNEMSAMFSEMGAFTEAFGMDQLNFGEFMGYFGIECANTLGLGGALFAAILGIGALAKEEKEHTAEFLLTHPVSRTHIIAEKLFATLAQVVILNLTVSLVTTLSILAIGESADAGKIALLFLAYLLLQIEIASITFGISAFIRGGGLGIGLGLSLGLYFINIVSNLVDEAEFLKYITPFGYTDSAEIMDSGINLGYLAVGVLFTAAAIFLAFRQYNKKDIL